jgi:hypothetical protein
MNVGEESILLNGDAKSIKALYDRVMEGFDAHSMVMASEPMEDEFYHTLYAPGYDENGVGEIVAQCK